MNGFNHRSITPKETGETKKNLKKWEKKASRWIKGHLLLSVLILIVGAFLIKGVVGAIRMGEPFSFKQIVLSAVTSGVVMDDYGHTNILLLGVGGEGHDGANLTDTMIVASIDHKNNVVPMLSIPRDLYVDNETVGWGTRLNSIYELIYDSTGSHEQAITELESEIETMLGLEIHYYAMIDFQGFEDIVDAVGGIEVQVESDIYDATYPADTGSYALYEPFYIEAGLQQMDGETALKYARSRHTTSDFDRARRQQQVIEAIKDKAMSAGVLLNPGKVSRTLEAVSNNFKTNMTLNEILNLAGKADKFSSDSMISEVVNDLPYERAGFLYTPEREQYGGAFVLVPYVSDFSELHTFSQLFFYHPDIYQNQTKIQVLNGTPTASLAGLTKMYLHRYGFNIVQFGNARSKDIQETTIYVLDPEALKKDETVDMLRSLSFGEISTEIPPEYQR